MQRLEINNETITSLQIAEVTEKKHKDVLRAIRIMEPSWEKVTGRKFSLSNYKDSTGRELPCYSLTKTESLFIATKFKDEPRARLVLRWEQLEREKMQATQQEPLSQAQLLLQSAQLLVDIENRQKANEQRTLNLENRLNQIEAERKEATQALLNAPLSSEVMPELKLRDKIRRLVNEYANATNIAVSEVWHSVYSQLYYNYHISINQYKKQNNKESKLDVAERNGILEKLDAVISTMVHQVRTKNNS